MTRENKKIATEKFDNGEILSLLKTHRPCFRPTWSNKLYYIQKLTIRERSIQEKIEFSTSETKSGNKIIILNP